MRWAWHAALLGVVGRMHKGQVQCCDKYFATECTAGHSVQVLGLILDAAKGFSTAPAQLATAGHRALGAVQGMCASSDIDNPSIRLHLWQQLVLPVVRYGCEIWGVHSTRTSQIIAASLTTQQRGCTWTSCAVYGHRLQGAQARRPAGCR